MSSKKPKPKMGRPPKPPGEKWAARVMVRMTPAEYRRLSSEARAAGTSRAGVLLESWRGKREG